MTQGKSIVVLAVVVILLGLAAGFLYWNNTQELSPNNPGEEGEAPLPPDIQSEDGEPEFPPIDPGSPSASDFLEELHDVK